MAQPPAQPPPGGSWGAPAPQLLQLCVLPENFCSQGSANPCQLPGQEQQTWAPWAPLVGVAPLAPWGPQAPPAGLQRAPCGCYFDPRVFHMEWRNVNLPPPATTTLSTAPLPSAALWGLGGCGTPLAWAVPGTPQGQMGVVAPAPLVLPTSSSSYQHIEGQTAQTNISGTATPAGALPGSDVPPSPCAAPQNQAAGDPADDLPVSEEVLLEEALRLFDCLLDTAGVSQDGPGSSPVPGDPSGTSAAVPPCPFASLSLPEELLTCDYSFPENIDDFLSLEEFNSIEMEPQEPWGDAGGDRPPSPPAAAKQGAKKRQSNTLPMSPSKRRAL